MKTLKVELPSGVKVTASYGENLRRVLSEHYEFLYHPLMRFIHCRGLGTCGTCALKISGKVSEPKSIEKWRLSFPPHKNSIDKGIRLACQVKVLGDLKLEKLEGLWGQGLSEE